MNSIATNVFAVAGLLGLIALLPPLATRLRLPTTVLLAALGVLLGVMIGAAGSLRVVLPEIVLIDFFEALGRFEITSGVFLWVFLPLLLFGAALDLDTRALRDDLGPVLLMAIVAVVATTLLAGLPVAYASGVGLASACLVAAIIATTDPIAVIAVFREVGAPRRLTSLVEGESLLNDAAAIALTASLLAIVTGGLQPSFTDIARDFAWDFVGGALLGLTLGRVAVALLGRLDEGGPAEITVSVALAYLAYALGEVYAGVSGVVATVLAGLAFGGGARVRLPSAAWRSLGAVWEQLGFWASSLVFVLASMLVPRTLASATWTDAGLLALLTLGALIARALILFGLLPIMRLLNLSARIQPAYKLVMLWGGLRGAVTLTLALAVTENPFVPEATQRLVAVLATGFVLFTLIVQAPTLRPLIRRLKLDRLSPADSFLRDRALRLTHKEIVERLGHAADAHGLEAGNETIGKLHRGQIDAQPEDPSLGPEMLRAQLITALLTLTRKELELYVEERALRVISRDSGDVLVAEARALADALRAEGLEGYRRAARKQLRPRRSLRFVLWLHRRLRIDRPLAAALSAQLERALAQRHVLTSLADFNTDRITGLFGTRIAEVAGRFLAQRHDNLERTIAALRLQYPDYWKRFGERYLTLAALRLEEEALRRMQAERLLAPPIIERMQGDLRQKIRRLEHAPPLDLRLETKNLIRQTTLFANLDPAQLEGVARLVQPRLALPGERIVARGAVGDAMYFIASGAVEVEIVPEPVQLGTGDFFGEMALFHDRPRLADVTAIGYCRLLVLTRKRFDELLRRQPSLARHMRGVAEARAG